jgi:hypothetical protein
LHAESHRSLRSRFWRIGSPPSATWDPSSWALCRASLAHSLVWPALILGGVPEDACVEGQGTCATKNGTGTYYTANEEYDPSCDGGGQCPCQDGVCPACNSPIIIDLTGEGFHLTSADDGVTFDIRGDGHPMKISWTAVDSHNAFLALDRNHNGKIDNGKELFGNFTAQPPSDDPNGYLALAVFDKPENGGNGDGVIDNRDAVWPELLLWIDENHDGISQRNELHHLDEMGVHSLSLKYSHDPYTDQFGNQFRYRGKVNPLGQPAGDDVDRTSYDVFFVQANSTRARPGRGRQAWLDDLSDLDRREQMGVKP